MAGTTTNANPIRETIKGYSNGAVTASQYLVETVVNARCRIAAVKASAQVAGTGAGNTVVDVLINGVSAYATAANKPTLPATSTGEFANTNPDGLRTLNPGDVIAIQVTSISTTGHARLMASVSLALL